MSVKKQRKSNDEIDQVIQSLYSKYQFIYNLSLSHIRTSSISQLRELLQDSKLLFGKQKKITKAIAKISKNRKFCSKIDVLLFTDMKVEDVNKIEIYDFYRANDVVERIDITIVEKEIEGYTENVDGKHILKKPIKYGKGEKISIEDAKVLKLAGIKLCKFEIKVVDSIKTNKE